ncbi:ABC1 kinase family protein [Phosphitispora sp. TUW77]|uniref:ABC1 kinase family protein n=1 Tax=Phosphitispora sp. TUW77 TaxID=3152361 RepID=UPI003AB7F2AE
MARKYRKVSRYREITGILVKYGFRYLLKPHKCLLPQMVRMVFEDLGPTFVKMGQLLSARPDLIPRDYVEELSRLQDNVEEVPESEIRNQFIKEMGKSPEEVFLEFNYKPMASASIGQVHEAVLPDGSKVVIKVQRPHLKQLIDGDIKILKRFAGILQKRTVIGKVCDVYEIIDVFERQIHKELDYLTEAVNTEAFFKEFADEESIIVPGIFSDYTTKEILTMEFVKGIRVEEFEEHNYSYDERSLYASNMMLSIYRPLFERGIFHGDPHPGNVLFQDNYRIVLIDFGIVGRFDRYFRRMVAELLVALADRDVPAVMNIIMETGRTTRRIHQQRFFEDVSEIVEKANGVTRGGIALSQLINGMIAISIEYGIKMPDNLFILGKTVMISENMSRRICPELDISEVIKPIAAEYLRGTLRPEVHNGSIYKQLSSITEGMTTFPVDVCKAVRNFANNDTRITFYHRNLNWLHDMLDISSSRIAFGLILAALIVGSALIMHAGKGPLLWGYPVLGTIGFVFSGLMGIMVLVAMLNSGRLR